MIDQLKVAAGWMEKAGAIIAVVLDPSSRWWLEDGSAAIQNILLAAHALGYGASGSKATRCRWKPSSRRCSACLKTSGCLRSFP